MVLGLLAMACAVVAVPAGIALAAVKANAVAAAGQSHGMPCDHPCPGCAKQCPEMGICLLKCFQPPLSEVATQTAFELPRGSSLVPLGRTERLAEAAVPPLLRPPST